MVKVTSKALDKTIEVDRIIGQYTGDQPGPTTIFIGGTHGNETSSIFALHKVFRALNRLKPPFKGEVIAAYVGNFEALEKGVRYVDVDMNRIWVPDRLKKLGFFEGKNVPKGHEQEEQKELLQLLHKTFEEAQGDIHVFDLHTTSSVSPPFIAIGDTIRNRKIALNYPLPCVVGFDEEMTGTFMNYINELGLKGVAFEAGEHFSLAAIENNVSFIWHSMAVTGCMQAEDIPRYNIHVENLAKSSSDRHKIFDLEYCYTIQKDEHFEMLPGFVTFDKVENGQVLAKNKDGEIKSHMDGRIFMPLYQQQGDDGYFLLNEISAGWLHTSEYLREGNAYRLLPLITGINTHPEDHSTLIIDSQEVYERYQSLLHILGFRRHRKEGDQIIITRRHYDVEEPDLKVVHE